MKTPKVRTTVAPWKYEVREAERLAKSSKVRSAFPGLGSPTKKKMLELAITLGLKEIDREARR